MKNKFLKKLLIAFVSFCFILGCSPVFDWRVVHQKENEWKVLFPGKPMKKIREFQLDMNGTLVGTEMEQYSTRVNQMNFIIDNSKVTSSKIKLSELAEKLKVTLERNFNLEKEESSGKSIKHYSGSISTAQKSFIKIRLMTTTLIKENSVVRAIVYGADENFSEEQATFFLKSLE